MVFEVFSICIECLLHLQSQATQPRHLKLDEFEFSRYFIEINKENTSLNLPIVCSMEALLDKMFYHLTASKSGLNDSLPPSVVLSICAYLP